MGLGKTVVNAHADGLQGHLAGEVVLGPGDLGAKGFKIKVSGQMPLQTIRAGVDYGFAEARTTYGIIGIKVWVNLGDQVAETVKR